MKIKNILSTGLLVIGLATVQLAQAGQPIVWTASFTNNIATNAAATSLTNNCGNVVWSSGGAYSTNYIDTLQSSTLTAWAQVAPTATYGNAAAGSWTFNGIVSPDLVTWVPWTNTVSFSEIASNTVAGTYVKIDATQFRYLDVTNITSTVTNGLVYNTNITFKILIKGP